jgi:tripartite ATP-independent transporter DctP family solute receptor
MGITRRNLLAATSAAAGLYAVPLIGRAQSTRLVFSHHLPTTHIGHAAAERFAARVAKGTNGAVTIDVKPASQLFNLRTSAEAIQLGTLDMCWTDLGTLANWQPQFGFISMPFLFNDFDHVKRVMYGPIGQQVVKDAKDTLNVDILSLGASGFRVFLGKKAIANADDVKGIKLRVPEIPTWVEMARALGANPSPIPAGEMYTALQTGVVDAVELPADYIVTSKLFEVAGFATKTYHIFTEVSMMASAKRMASLPPDVQKLIRETAADEVANLMWNANIREQQSAWDELAKRVKANPSPDVASFRTKMAPVYDSFAKRGGAKGKAWVEACQAAGKA